VSTKDSIRAHHAERHPERLAEMDTRQADKARVGTKWRCTKCEEQFCDVPLYEAHHAIKHQRN